MPGRRKAPRQDNVAVSAAVMPAAKRDAEIAAHRIEGQRAAALRRVFQKQRGTDRVIDRAEYAKREQRRREHRQRRRESRRHERQPAAEIESDHHIAAAPAVGEPAGRQRKQAECGERSGAERDQLGIGAAVDGRKLDDDGRIDQDDKVIERVSAVEEADRALPVLPVGRAIGAVSGARRHAVVSARTRHTSLAAPRGCPIRAPRTARHML